MGSSGAKPEGEEEETVAGRGRLSAGMAGEYEEAKVMNSAVGG
jgi:hypothetical protein